MAPFGTGAQRLPHPPMAPFGTGAQRLPPRFCCILSWLRYKMPASAMMGCHSASSMVLINLKMRSISVSPIHPFNLKDKKASYPIPQLTAWPWSIPEGSSNPGDHEWPNACGRHWCVSHKLPYSLRTYDSIARPIMTSQSRSNSLFPPQPMVPNLVAMSALPHRSSNEKRARSFTTAILMISAIPCRMTPAGSVLKNEQSVRVRMGGAYAPKIFLKPNPSQHVLGEGPASIPETMDVLSITYGVLRWYSAVANPPMSAVTPPPTISTGSFRWIPNERSRSSMSCTDPMCLSASSPLNEITSALTPCAAKYAEIASP